MFAILSKQLYYHETKPHRLLLLTALSFLNHGATWADDSYEEVAYEEEVYEEGEATESLLTQGWEFIQEWGQTLLNGGLSLATASLIYKTWGGYQHQNRWLDY